MVTPRLHSGQAADRANQPRAHASWSTCLHARGHAWARPSGGASHSVQMLCRASSQKPSRQTGQSAWTSWARASAVFAAEERFRPRVGPPCAAGASVAKSRAVVGAVAGAARGGGPLTDIAAVLCSSALGLPVSYWGRPKYHNAASVIQKRVPDGRVYWGCPDV